MGPQASFASKLKKGIVEFIVPVDMLATLESKEGDGGVGG